MFEKGWYMSKIRKDSKGRVLHKGEMYIKSKALYCYGYTDAFGKRKYFYDQDLIGLREKEEEFQRHKVNRLESYSFAKADVNYVFDRYIATKSELRSTTRSNYIYTYDRYIRKGFGRKRIADVKYYDVLSFYQALLNNGLKVSTVESVHTVLHPTFQLAVRDNVIGNNPTNEVMAEVKKKLKGRPEPRHALSVEEQRAFLTYIDKPEYIRWSPLFIVMFGTGCRVGEVIGLRWEDVDFESGMISINHNITYYPRTEKDNRCEYEVSLPKTKSGIRKIPMLERVRQALLTEKQNQEKFGYHCIAEIGGMKGFIFCNRFGTLRNPESINREIKRIVDAYNSAEEVRAAREQHRLTAWSAA